MENGRDGGRLLPIIQLYADFMTRVTKFEALGSKLLVSFQQALGFLQRPPFEKTSTLIDSIIKAHGTERFLSYVDSGYKNIHDNVQNASKWKSHSNFGLALTLFLVIQSCTISLTTYCGFPSKEVQTCHLRLLDHINKAKSIIGELECLLDEAASIVQITEEQDEEEEVLSDLTKPNVTDFASTMAIIYSMVKQDYIMQDRIVSSLSIKSSAAELETYCLMWSLRPFIDDEVMQQAWSLVPCPSK